MQPECLDPITVLGSWEIIEFVLRTVRFVLTIKSKSIPASHSPQPQPHRSHTSSIHHLPR
jgi:hypothetical protein